MDPRWFRASRVFICRRWLRASRVLFVFSFSSLIQGMVVADTSFVVVAAVAFEHGEHKTT